LANARTNPNSTQQPIEAIAWVAPLGEVECYAYISGAGNVSADKRLLLLSAYVSGKRMSYIQTALMIT